MKKFIVVQRVFVQVSSDYQTVCKARTLIVTPATTVGEIMHWAKAANVVERGDVVITEQDAMVDLNIN